MHWAGLLWACKHRRRCYVYFCLFVYFLFTIIASFMYLNIYASLFRGSFIRLLAGTFFVLLLAGAQAQTHYYLRVDSLNPATGAVVRGTPQNRLFWTRNADGTKGAVPPNFTAANQVFHAQAGGFTVNGNMVISGTGSKLVVGADTAVAFTVGTGITAKLTGTIEVLDKATFVYGGFETSGLNFTNLAPGSTVRYQGNVGSVQQVLPLNYYHLSLNPNGSVYPVQLPGSGVVGVAGIFTTRQSLYEGSTVDFNGTGGQSIPGGNYFNITNSGSKGVPDTLKGTVFVGGAYNPVNPIVAAAGSTLNFNGLSAQGIAISHPLNNLAFSSGSPYYVKNYHAANKTITIVKPTTPLAVGQKISGAAALTGNGPTLGLDTSVAIEAIKDDTILTLSKAPMLRMLAFKPGHAVSGYIPDTVYAAGYDAASKTFTVPNAAIPLGLAVGDTLKGTSVAANTIVTGITGTSVVVAVQNALGVATTTTPYQTNYYGVVNFGTAGRAGSDKTLGGTFTIGGTFNPGRGNVGATGTTFVYNGTGQNVAATTGGFVYDHLTIAQQGDAPATLAGAATVNGVLTLNSRLNTLVGTGVRLLTLGQDASVVTGSAGAYVSGPLAKVMASTGTFVFPIGKGGVRRRLSVTPKTSDSKTYRAEFVANKPLFTAVAAPLVGVDSNYFKLGVSGRTVDTDSVAALVGLDYSGLSVSNSANLRVAHAGANGAASVWRRVGNNPSTADFFVVSDSMFQRFNTGNNANYFAVASTTETALPVQLVSFRGVAAAGSNVLGWSTAGELNAGEFVVERQVPGGVFVAIGSVAAKGTGSSLLQYGFTDKTPVSGVDNRYRLKLVDKNGKGSYSAVIILNNTSAAKAGLTGVYPNPVRNRLTAGYVATSAGNVTLLLADAGGKLVKQWVLAVGKGSNVLGVDVVGTKPGIYSLTVINKGVKEVVRIVVL